MLNRLASLAMSTSFLKALPAKLDIKRHSPSILYLQCWIFGPSREITCLPGFANNTGADQPAHLGSLISAFIIRFLESTICKLATGKISIH